MLENVSYVSNPASRVLIYDLGIDRGGGQKPQRLGNMDPFTYGIRAPAQPSKAAAPLHLSSLLQHPRLKPTTRSGLAILL